MQATIPSWSTVALVWPSPGYLVARSCPVRRLLAFRSFTSRDWIGRPIPAGRARQGLGQAPNLRDIFEAGEINIASHAGASLIGDLLDKAW